MFTLTEEHTMLRDAAKGFVADKLPTTHLRTLRDTGNADGFDRALWAEIAAMGWTGVIVPENFGGAGLGYRGLGLILEEMGRTLAPSPLLSTGLIGASAIVLGGDEATKAAWLPKIATGETVIAFCIDEHAHHAPARIKTTLSGGKVTGAKSFVADGQAADTLLVAALEGSTPVLALVDAKAAGVKRTALSTVDARGAADIDFDGASALAVLRGETLLDRVLDRARIGLACEMQGQATAAFEQTADYLKTRTQFGQLIGSFQSLQHRAAKMLVELELLKSCIGAALAALDEGKDDKTIGEAASLAKAYAGEVLHKVSNEMVQMHGGIGMTDAHDSGLYLKRARVAEALYGSASFHRDRYASLGGY
jgi:alkylation response protein AidB-like acyl-CoA dehydrogenase